MKRSVLCLAIFVSVASSLIAEEVQRPLVTVSGQGEVLVVPDEVAFRLRVVTLDKDLLAAKTKNDEIVKKTLALAPRYGISEDKVQTGYIHLEQKYSDEEATKRPAVFQGYEVTKNILLVLSDVGKTEPLLSDIFTAGVTHIDSVGFRSTKIRENHDKARAMAIKAAQEKASALAKEIGQEIGKAYSIAEETPGYYATNNINYNAPVESDVPTAPTVALGRISFSARVTAKFELK